MIRRGATRQTVPADKNDNGAQQVAPTLARPFCYLFVNEGNETGNLIFILCFPMAPLDVDGPHLETGDGGRPPDWMKEQGCGELGAPCYR